MKSISSNFYPKIHLLSILVILALTVTFNSKLKFYLTTGIMISCSCMNLHSSLILIYVVRPLALVTSRALVLILTVFQPPWSYNLLMNALQNNNTIQCKKFAVAFISHRS